MLQHAWLVVRGILVIALFPAVTPYIAIIMLLESIHFADEFFRPSSEILFSVLVICLKFISPVFSHGIEPS